MYKMKLESRSTSTPFELTNMDPSATLQDPGDKSPEKCVPDTKSYSKRSDDNMDLLQEVILSFRGMSFKTNAALAELSTLMTKIDGQLRSKEASMGVPRDVDPFDRAPQTQQSIRCRWANGRCCRRRAVPLLQNCSRSIRLTSVSMIQSMMHIV